MRKHPPVVLCPSALAALLAMAAACGKKEKPTESAGAAPDAPGPVATPPRPAPTPAELAVARRYDALLLQIGEGHRTAGDHVHFDTARLRIDREYAPRFGIPDEPALVRLLEQCQPVVESAIELAKEPASRWPPSDDQDVYIKRAGEMRVLIRLLRTDAGRCFQKRDAEGVSRRLAAMYGLALHASQQGGDEWESAWTFGALAYAELANDAAVLFAKAGGLDDAGRALVRGALGRLDGAARDRIVAGYDRAVRDTADAPRAPGTDPAESPRRFLASFENARKALAPARPANPAGGDGAK